MGCVPQCSSCSWSLHYGGQPNSPWESGLNMPSSTVIPSFKPSKWPDGSFNLQLNRIIISWWKYFSFGIKKSRSSEYDITGAGDKNFVCGSLRVILNGVSLSLTSLDLETVNAGHGELTVYWTMVQNMHGLLEDCSSPASYCHPVLCNQVLESLSHYFIKSVVSE